MPNLLDKLYWYEADHASRRPSSPRQELVDVENGHAVLDFTYHYLETHSRPPTDEEVHRVTATIARYKGSQVVPWVTLESFLGELFSMERA